MEMIEIVLHCSAAKLDATKSFFEQQLGLKLVSIFPADSPRVALFCAPPSANAGLGMRIRLEDTGEATPSNSSLRILSRDPKASAAAAGASADALEVMAPNGTQISFVSSDPPLAVPALRPCLCISHGDAAEWGVGRASMRYRDLCPDRQGGCFIASHIHIPKGGPVPDYVHFHKIAFQMIFCWKGWVRLVYEDQGEPFILNAGDCVLQPPLIRHKVLECGDNLEVIEIVCPAEHDTVIDHEMVLPNVVVNRTRSFSGQNFHRHVRAEAPWRTDLRVAALGRNFEAQDVGMEAATGGKARVRIAKATTAADCNNGQLSPLTSHSAEFMFVFVLVGALDFSCPETSRRLVASDSVVIPAELPYRFENPSPDAEILEVVLPAQIREQEHDPPLIEAPTKKLRTGPAENGA